MSGICPELDARLSAELDRYYFSTDGSGLNLDRREKHRVINALHRLGGGISKKSLATESALQPRISEK